MSSERLDQNCRIEQGTRDAIHVPIVVARAQDYKHRINPSDWVKFTDDSFMTVVPCDKKDADGIANPFLEEISSFDNFVVFLIPGITTPVRHNFQINKEQNTMEDLLLEQELEERKREDPECAGCYEIRNKEIIRAR